VCVHFCFFEEGGGGKGGRNGGKSCCHAIRVRSLLVLVLFSKHACLPTFLSSPPPGSLRQKMDGPYDSRVLPILVTVVLMSFLGMVW
jgi:hypothetical protein